MQVPVEFGYERAASVSDAIALLTRHGPESRLVAGGHSLIPMMKLRLAEPEHADRHQRPHRARRHPSTAAITCASARWSGTPSCSRSAVVGEHFPILHDAERVIADPVVRNRGTVGGSVCQADPSEDLSAVLRRCGPRW